MSDADRRARRWAREAARALLVRVLRAHRLDDLCVARGGAAQVLADALLHARLVGERAGRRGR